MVLKPDWGGGIYYDGKYQRLTVLRVSAQIALD